MAIGESSVLIHRALAPLTHCFPLLVQPITVTKVGAPLGDLILPRCARIESVQFSLFRRLSGKRGGDLVWVEADGIARILQRLAQVGPRNPLRAPAIGSD